jgi:glycine/D-amino acid oxidase-like deaminating enzyme
MTPTPGNAAPSAASDDRYRAISLWHDTCPGSWRPRPALPGDRTADVVIVGAGYTGLWTAYYLSALEPSLRVVVVEREVAGFGASGRNGGWCSGIFPASWRRIAGEAGLDGVRRLQHALNDSVDEVGRVAALEGIDCHFRKGGYLSVARNAAQWQRAQAEVAGARGWGFGEDVIELLDAAATRERLSASQARGATYVKHCAALHPARLVRGLAEVVERRGVDIYEGTAALSVRPHSVVTEHGTVTGEVVVLATEGYTADLGGHRRDVAPMYSLMVATEPLSDTRWEALGLRGRETFSDKRHLRIYGQRTADGRIAFGGRGAPYHFGSRLRPEFDRVLASTRCCAPPCASCCPTSATSASPTPGAATSASLATGTPPRATTALLGWPGQVVTWATASPPPTWPGGPSPTSSPGATPTSSICRGRSAARASGSPSRCAGSASTR